MDKEGFVGKAMFAYRYSHRPAVWMRLLTRAGSSRPTRTALEKAAAEEKKARSKGAASRNKEGRRPKAIPHGKNDDGSGVGGHSA